MRIKLIVKDDNDRRILQNAEEAARRVARWPAWKRNMPELSENEQSNVTVTKRDEQSD